MLSTGRQAKCVENLSVQPKERFLTSRDGENAIVYGQTLLKMSIYLKKSF